MANKARTHRKAMLGRRLEPVTKTVIRHPYDGSMAKSGLVHFTDDEDNTVASVTLRVVDGELVLDVRSTQPIQVDARQTKPLEK